MWDYDKNRGLTPQDVFSRTNMKVWWKCSRGHSWRSAISDAVSTEECPYCTSKKISEIILPYYARNN